MAPIERPVATGQVPTLGGSQGAVEAVLPATSVQLFPPSVDLYNPTPASESPEPFGSPVPAYSVFPLGSVESKITEPIALEGMPLFDGCQFGCGSSALSACQTPPPAAPMKIAQLNAVQFGWTAIAVARPEKIVPALAPVDSDATKASAGTPLGPSSCQFVFLPPGSLAIAFAAFDADICCAAAIEVAGGGRFSYASLAPRSPCASPL